MNKSILREFSIESRKDLMERIKLKLNLYYVDEKFSSKQNGDMYSLVNENHTLNLTKEEFQKREVLLKRIKEIGMERVIEEASYTWFNRLIALRYMEIHDFLPLGKNNESLGIRVLSSNDNTPNPEIMKFSNLLNEQLDIGFDKVIYSSLNNDNEKFKYLIQLLCNKLKKVFPDIFNGITDYIDLLIPENLLSETGFVTKMIKNIPEDNFNQVEIIGWLYQYYNQTEKDRVISAKKTYKKHEIAYATQLFTPDWIVKYMVDNTLGKYWLTHGGSSSFKNELSYLINKDYKNEERIDPREISFIDPCCGSGHVLVYAFDIFAKIYEDAGFNKKDIAELILKNNIYGLDVDDRAGQLSLLSVLLKAREYDRNIFNNDVIKNLNILSIKESANIDDFCIETLDDKFKPIMNELKDKYINAKEIGSLIYGTNDNYNELIEYLYKDNTLEKMLIRDQITTLMKQNSILSHKYNIVVTNPPYLNNNLMSANMKSYLLKEFKNAKSDLFSAFIIRNINFGTESAELGFMTPYVWMFISSYEELRNYLINNMNISSLIQLEYSALEEATVPICTFTIKKGFEHKIGTYFRLSDFTGGMDVQNKKYLEINANCDSNYMFEKNSLDFLNIPGSPIAYWIDEKYQNAFKNGQPLGTISDVKQGIATSDNNKFLRLWYEVDNNNIFFDCKSHKEASETSKVWYPYNKGGEFRKWYGNNDYVVNWKNDGEELRNFKGAVLRNPDFYFKPSITWSLISSSNIAFRSKEVGNLFDVAGMSLFPKDEDFNYILGFNNTKIVRKIMNFIAPTLNFQVGDIAKIPIIFDDNKKELINNLVNENIKISKEDWDSFETSWNFKFHPYLKYKTNSIEDAFKQWTDETNQRFTKVKENEQKLNDIFTNIYSMEDEKIVIEDEDITIRKSDSIREVKSLISYAIGCIFGRYSLLKEGVVCSNNKIKMYEYSNVIPDEDNIVPISESKDIYYSDDMVEKVKDFILKVFGKDNYEQNIEYIANQLGRKGTELPEDTIRRYLINDFFNDHVKMYQKRPIYWYIDSGKRNGFKAFIYMHRYDNQLISKLRVDYLHKTQDSYNRIKEDCQYKLGENLEPNERKAIQIKLNDINSKLDECNKFDDLIDHISNMKIDINLDDGIKNNYDKFSDILAKIK